MKVRVDLSDVADWESFHRRFKDVMGFPDFYGMNLNAWIDCMGYIDSPESGMTRVTVAPGESLTLELAGFSDFRRRNPEIAAELMDAIEFVNERFAKDSETRIIAVVK